MAAIVVAASPAASTRTITLNWREHFSFNRGRAVFITKSVSYGSAWKVSAKIINRSKFPIRWTRDAVYLNPPCAGGFAIGFRNDPRRPAPGFAKYIKPKFPNPLKPGKAWTGTFGAPEKLVRGKYYHVTYACFLTPAASGYEGFWWTSDHAFRPR